jgi:hypothetical protein
MSWIEPLGTETDLLELFRELGEPDRLRVIRLAWNLTHPDHFFGGPMHGAPIDQKHWRGGDDPPEIEVAYDECRRAVYRHAKREGLGIYVFDRLRLIDVPQNEKGGAA